MKSSYDLLSAYDREGVGCCQSLAVVVFVVVLALFAGFAFAQAATDSFVVNGERIGPSATLDQREAR